MELAAGVAGGRDVEVDGDHADFAGGYGGGGDVAADDGGGGRGSGRGGGRAWGVGDWSASSCEAG